MDNPLTKTVLTRLHLRENWPLWVAGVVVSLAIFSLLYSQKILRNADSFSRIIIYPVLILSNYALFLAPVLLFLILFIIVRRRFRRHERWLAVGVAFLANGIACFTCAFYFLFGLGIEPFQSLEFKGNIYHLAKQRDDTDLDHTWFRFLVFECDVYGIQCTLKEKLPVSLVGADTHAQLILANNGLFVEVGDRQLPVSTASK
jgi:hypothetical protein